MLKRRHIPRMPSASKLRTDYLVLCALFLCGVLLGHLAGSLISREQYGELSDYLLHYVRGNADAAALGSVFFAFFSDAVVLVLLGAVAWGVWTVPLYMVGQGFFLAFAVHCFTSALGRGGVSLAFAAFGIRCLFILPCSFYLASRSRTAAKRLRRGGRSKPDRSTVYPLAVCAIILLIGCVIELSLVPRFYSLILNRIT